MGFCFDYFFCLATPSFLLQSKAMFTQLVQIQLFVYPIGIWSQIIDCPHCVLQPFRSNLCVHAALFHFFRNICIGFYGIDVALVGIRQKQQQQQPQHGGVCNTYIVLFTTWQCVEAALDYSGRNVRDWYERLYSTLVSTGFKICIRHIVIFYSSGTLQQHNLVPAATFSMFPITTWCLHFTWREKVT